MNTSSDELETIIRQLGLPAKEFRELVSRAVERHSTYTFEHLVEKLQSTPVEHLSLALQLLEQAGLVTQKVRVESPTMHGGIGDYSSIVDVPEEMYDPRADADITVTPDDLRVVFLF